MKKKILFIIILIIMVTLVTTAFTDVSMDTESSGGLPATRADNLDTIQVGRGSKTLKVDERGLWLGAEQYADAPFRVDMEGNLYASVADLVDRLNIGTGDTSFHVDENGNLWLGNELYASAPFKVDKEGNLGIGNGALSIDKDGNFAIGGSDATSFHIDKDGNIWSGHASLASAPFKVENDGDLTAKGVTIKDSAGTSIIDSTGLISSANFQSDSVTHTGSQTTTSTSYVDVTGMSLSFTLARESKVLFMATITGCNQQSDLGYSMATIIDLDGSTIGGMIVTPGFVNLYGALYQNGSGQIIQTVSAGSHTLKLKFKSSNASGTAAINTDAKFLGYVVLGT